MQWAADDHHKNLAKMSLLRHSYSGQNTALNQKYQAKLQLQRKAYIDRQKRRIQQEVRRANSQEPRLGHRCVLPTALNRAELGEFCLFDCG